MIRIVTYTARNERPGEFFWGKKWRDFMLKRSSVSPFRLGTAKDNNRGPVWASGISLGLEQT